MAKAKKTADGISEVRASSQERRSSNRVGETSGDLVVGNWEVFFFGANGTCPEKNPHRAAAAAAVGGLPPPKKSLGVNTKWVIFLNTFFIFNDPGLPFKNLHGIDCEPRVKAWLKP